MLEIVALHIDSYNYLILVYTVKTLVNIPTSNMNTMRNYVMVKVIFRCIWRTF